MKQLLFGLIILCGIACQNSIAIDTNAECRKEMKPLEGKKFGDTVNTTLLNTTAEVI